MLLFLCAVLLILALGIMRAQCLCHSAASELHAAASALHSLL